MKPRLAAAIALPSALLAASCVLDLGDLTGGKADGGATGGGGATSLTSSTTGDGPGGSSTSSGSTSSSTTSTGTGGAPTSVLKCDPCPGAGCAPIALATGADADGPNGVAVDTDALYWVNQTGNAVMRLPASGGAPAPIASANGPTAIAAKGGFVVWAAEDGVFACTGASCAQSTIKIAGATVMGSIRGVAYDGQYVIFTDRGTSSTNGKVARCPPTAGCPGAQNLATDLFLPTGISLHADQVFFTELGTGNQNGNVVHAPKGAPSPSITSAALNFPTAVVADDSFAYFTESRMTGGKIHRCPWPAGYCNTPLDIAAGLSAPLDIALSTTRVYWTDSGSDKLLSCPIGGCGANAPREHAASRPGLRRLALSSTCVFFTDDHGGGSVSKVAR